MRQSGLRTVRPPHPACMDFSSDIVLALAVMHAWLCYVSEAHTSPGKYYTAKILSLDETTATVKYSGYEEAGEDKVNVS